MKDSKNVVLLVEDNPDDEELALMALQESGIANPIQVARDGVQALDLLLPKEDSLHEANPPPALVLLDLQLPRIGGFEVLQAIRSSERTRNVVVVIMSSSDTDEDIARAYELGCNSYVHKPVEASEYTEAVQRLGTYWLRLNESVR